MPALNCRAAYAPYKERGHGRELIYHINKFMWALNFHAACALYKGRGHGRDLWNKADGAVLEKC